MDTKYTKYIAYGLLAYGAYKLLLAPLSNSDGGTGGSTYLELLSNGYTVQQLYALDKTGAMITVGALGVGGYLLYKG